jgi:hypothetical protein
MDFLPQADVVAIREMSSPNFWPKKAGLLRRSACHPTQRSTIAFPYIDNLKRQSYLTGGFASQVLRFVAALFLLRDPSKGRLNAWVVCKENFWLGE